MSSALSHESNQEHSHQHQHDHHEKHAAGVVWGHHHVRDDEHPLDEVFISVDQAYSFVKVSSHNTSATTSSQSIHGQPASPVSTHPNQSAGPLAVVD